jgi:hypothetical protein
MTFQLLPTPLGDYPTTQKTGLKHPPRRGRPTGDKNRQTSTFFVS